MAFIILDRYLGGAELMPALRAYSHPARVVRSMLVVMGSGPTPKMVIRVTTCRAYEGLTVDGWHGSENLVMDALLILAFGAEAWLPVVGVKPLRRDGYPSPFVADDNIPY